MIDILAGFSLANAASRKENPVQLIADAEALYHLYSAKKPIDYHGMAASGQLKTIIQAAARVLGVANSLVDDADQMKNITELLASL